MSSDNVVPEGPNFSAGVRLDALPEGGMIAGHVGGEPALLVQRGKEIFVLGATCTHYGGPLAKGLIEGETVRCPWHHACFSLRTGEPLRAPALDPLPRWRVECNDGVAFAREKLSRQPRPARQSDSSPASIVIVGGGRLETRRPRRSAAKVTPVQSPCSAPTRPCRAIGRTCPRTIWPGRRPRNGRSSGPPISTGRTGIDVRLNAYATAARPALA